MDVVAGGPPAGGCAVFEIVLDHGGSAPARV